MQDYNKHDYKEKYHEIEAEYERLWERYIELLNDKENLERMINGK